MEETMRDYEELIYDSFFFFLRLSNLHSSDNFFFLKMIILSVVLLINLGNIFSSWVPELNQSIFMEKDISEYCLMKCRNSEHTLCNMVSFL